MTTARYPQITDELLSAYLDGEVDAAERSLVEAAAADDPEVAWELESLRATVQLLHELPALALPRSFVLTPDQAGAPAVAAAGPEPLPAPAPSRPTAQPGFWSRQRAAWQEFWRAGNPALRNAMAASFAAFLLLLAAPSLLAPHQAAQQQGIVMLRQNLNQAGNQIALPQVDTAQVDTAQVDTAQMAAPASRAALAVEPAAEPLAVALEEADQAYPAPLPASDAAQALAPLAGEVESTQAMPAQADTAMTPGGPAADAPVLAAAAPPVASAGADAPAAEIVIAAAPPAAARPVAGIVQPTELRLYDANDALSAAAAPAPAAGEPLADPRAAMPIAADGESGSAAAPAPLAKVADQNESAAAPAAAAIAIQESSAPAQTAGAEPTLAPEPTAAATAIAMAPPARVTARAGTDSLPSRPAPAEQLARRAVADNPTAAQRAAYPQPAAQPIGIGLIEGQALWLLLAQAVAAGGAVIFGLLWWRTRRA